MVATFPEELPLHIATQQTTTNEHARGTGAQPRPPRFFVLSNGNLNLKGQKNGQQRDSIPLLQLAR